MCLLINVRHMLLVKHGEDGIEDWPAKRRSSNGVEGADFIIVTEL